MHLRSTLSCAAMIAAAWAPAAMAGGMNIQPGKWELTMTMEMEGVPPQKPFSVTSCITPDQVKDPKTFGETMNKRSKCQVQDLKTDGDSVSWSFQCDNGSHGSAQMRTAGDSYEGTLQIDAVKGPKGSPMHMTQHLKGKRLGDTC